MLETLATMILAFAGTNIDDLFVNMLFFVQAQSGREVRSMIVGKYLGMEVLVLSSLLGASFLHFVPGRIIGLLGAIPIGLGIKEGITVVKSRERGKNREKDSTNNKEPENMNSVKKSTGLSGDIARTVALVTISNGADNIGVYVPLFAGYSVFQLTMTAAVFSFMTGFWCFIGKKMSDLPVLHRIFICHKTWLVPVVYLVLGIYIIMKSLW